MVSVIATHYHQPPSGMWKRLAKLGEVGWGGGGAVDMGIKLSHVTQTTHVWSHGGPGGYCDKYVLSLAVFAVELQCFLVTAKRAVLRSARVNSLTPIHRPTPPPPPLPPPHQWSILSFLDSKIHQRACMHTHARTRAHTHTHHARTRACARAHTHTHTHTYTIIKVL